MAGDKKNKIEQLESINDSVEYILENKCGWSEFISYHREKYGTSKMVANRTWVKCWEVIAESFDEDIKHTIGQTVLELENLKQEAKTNNDRKIWLEVLKYQNKIKGGEIERAEVNVKGEITLSWGDED